MLDVLEVPWVQNLFLESFLDILRLFGGVLGVLFESCKCAGQRGSVRLIFAGGERSGWSGCGCKNFDVKKLEVYRNPGPAVALCRKPGKVEVLDFYAQLLRYYIDATLCDCACTHYIIRRCDCCRSMFFNAKSRWF